MARKNSRAFVLLAVAALAVAVIAFVLWPRSGSAETRARATAKSVACNVAQHGLGVRTCFQITEFSKVGSATWRVKIAHEHGCWLVRGDGGPTLRAWKSTKHS